MFLWQIYLFLIFQNDELESFQNGVDTIYNGCTTYGSTPTAKTPDAIVNSIKTIYTNRYNAGVSATKKGNATASQVLDGRTFTNSSSVGIEGTMPNRDNLNWSSSNTTYSVPAGYYSGGTLDSRPSYNAGVSATKKGNATAGNVLSGKTFTSTAGVNLTGTMPNRGTLNWSSSNTTKTVSAGYYSGGTLDSRPSYTAGYNAGKSAGQSDVAGSYNISFTINARGGDNGSHWMKYTDQITINVSKSGVPTLGSPSFKNAQIRSEYGESYKLTKK